MLYRCFWIVLFCIAHLPSSAQSDFEDQLGAWYMVFWSASLHQQNPRPVDKISYGFQGDVQFRNWDWGSDMEQWLLRAGFWISPPNADVRFTAGYCSVWTGAFGESKETVPEYRIYQEALLPQKVGSRVFLTHRFRYEQRWIEGQDFRTRYRYFLSLNLPFNRTDLGKGSVYAALYGEAFLNGERFIGDGRTVEVFDRARLHAALGYGLTDHVRLQAGYMEQTTGPLSKGQAQLACFLNW